MNELPHVRRGEQDSEDGHGDQPPTRTTPPKRRSESERESDGDDLGRDRLRIESLRVDRIGEPERGAATEDIDRAAVRDPPVHIKHLGGA